jgi:hypothetical protein
VISESIVGAIFGTRLLYNAIAGKGVAVPGETSAVADRLAGPPSQIWELMLAGIATEASLPYFREFLAREALRHGRPAASPPAATAAIPEVS